MSPPYFWSGYNMSGTSQEVVWGRVLKVLNPFWLRLLAPLGKYSRLLVPPAFHYYSSCSLIFLNSYFSSSLSIPSSTCPPVLPIHAFSILDRIPVSSKRKEIVRFPRFFSRFVNRATPISKYTCCEEFILRKSTIYSYISTQHFDLRLRT